MIAHVSIGVTDIDRSKRFYEAALEPLGYKCLRAARTLLGYGYGRDSIALWIVQAEHPVPADEKSGLHFCFAALDAAAVDAFHAAALRSGGQDNGDRATHIFRYDMTGRKICVDRSAGAGCRSPNQTGNFYSAGWLF